MENLTALMVVMLAVVSLAFGLFTMRVAEAKGYPSGAWFAGGFFCWFIALIAIAGMPVAAEPKVENQPQQRQGGTVDTLKTQSREERKRIGNIDRMFDDQL